VLRKWLPCARTAVVSPPTPCGEKGFPQIQLIVLMVVFVALLPLSYPGVSLMSAVVACVALLGGVIVVLRLRVSVLAELVIRVMSSYLGSALRSAALG
jgi:hypothetical protein